MASALMAALLAAAAPATALAAPGPAAPPRRAPAATLEGLLAGADTAVREGRAPEAERLLAAAGRDFGSVRALLQLGRLQAARKDARAALATVEKARTLAPNSEEVLSTFAQLALAVRAPAAAIRALEPLTRMAPTVAQHHYLLGVALLQAGDMAGAADALLQAERLEPDRPLTLVALGLALNNRKLYDQARPRLQRALELEPASVEALAALAESEEGLGEMAAAEEHARRALAQAEGHAGANQVLGVLRMKQDRHAEARDALLRALAADGEAPKTLYLLSLVYARLGQETASQAYREAYETQRKAVEQRVEAIRKEGGFAGGGSRE